MPLNTQEIVNVCSQIAEEENLKVCVTESVKGACIAGSCALAGGLLGGPVGLAVGGIIGSVGAAIKGTGKYKSVVEIIMYDMTPLQRERMAASITSVIEDIAIEDLTTLLIILAKNPDIKLLVLDVMRNFLKNQMNLSLL